MSNQADIRSYNNPWPPRFSKEAQAAKLTGTPYVEDKSGEIIDALIRSLRPGGIVEVVELGLLAPVRGRPSKRREALAERVERIRDRKARIREVATGDQSDERGKSAKMLLRGYDFIANSGRGAAGKSKSGRPAHRERYAGEQWKSMGHIWDSRKYDTADKAMAAIHALGIKVKRGYMYRYFGKRD